MDLIPFFKMSGSGNDFIIINNMKLKFNRVDLPSFARAVCCRCLSVGADGLIFIEKSEISDFKWIFFNSDGSKADMCGNGARCVARYAYVNGIADKDMQFETDAGIVSAKILCSSVKIKMTDPKNIRLSYQILMGDSNLFISSVNTGVPHAVIFVDNIEDIDVKKVGKNVSHHDIFQPERVNVNFAQVVSGQSVVVRTYERGVEGETLACGTGNVAVALMCATHHGFASPILLATRSGARLKVYFKKSGDVFRDVFLEGDARIIYTGMLREEGWKYF